MAIPSIPINRSFGPLQSDDELHAIWKLAEAEFAKDKGEFVGPLMQSLPADQQQAVFHGILHKWNEAGWPFNPGKELAACSQFSITRIREILYSSGNFPNLGVAFCSSNFKAWTLLESHPEFSQISAEDLVKAINWAIRRVHAKNFHKDLANALVGLLPRNLFTKVMEHQNLHIMCFIELEKLVKRIPRLFFTALSAARYEQNLSPLKNLVQSPIFEPRIFTIVDSFLSKGSPFTL